MRECTYEVICGGACMCIGTYMLLYVCVCVYTVYIQTYCIHTYVYLHTITSTYYLHTYIHSCLHMCMYACMPVYMYPYTHAYIHMCRHTSIMVCIPASCDVGPFRVPKLCRNLHCTSQPQGGVGKVHHLSRLHIIDDIM